LWPALDQDELILRLFDSELAAESLASVAEHADSTPSELTAAGRAGLTEALDALGDALRDGAPRATLQRAERLAGELTGDGRVSGAASYRLALATEALVAATAQTRALAEHAVDGGVAPGAPTPPAHEPGPVDGPEDEDQPPDQERRTGSIADRLRPSTRQAIQVAIATGLAIIAGELISPSRWYWAVIAAFVIFNGTTSRGEVLTKGWQRLLGTLAGVLAGVLIATLVNGNTYISLVLIFACMFSDFYLIQIAYGLMIFWITTMLACSTGCWGSSPLRCC